MLHPFTMSQKPLRVAVLGSTGSVGLQALDVLPELGCDIVMLSAGRNAAQLAEQARRYRPSVCTMDSERAAKELRLLLAGEDIRVYGGSDAVCRAVEEVGADIVIHSIAGLVGLPAALAAASTGARLAMANKEAIIAAGDSIRDALRRSGGILIPVDSEHSAIFQCLSVAAGGGEIDPTVVRRILLTASGGPFFSRTRTELAAVTPSDALAHPTWKMGPKITVDSATLMNKGFEIIEAVRLFGVPEEKVEVLVHRQSIIHSMVEYIDNTVLAQLGLPDMRACVRYAVTYPTRAAVDSPGVDFLALRSLTFDPPDTDAFPLLDAARDAVRRGGIYPTALIAADEEAVAAFLQEKIPFLAIPDAVRETLARLSPAAAETAEDIYAAEQNARVLARQVLSSYGG